MDQAAMLKIRDRLQAIENVLLAVGFDDFTVATTPALAVPHLARRRLTSGADDLHQGNGTRQSAG
jgi:hypothetical protein